MGEAGAGTVDTGKSADRRMIRFSSLAELRADVERVAASERAGTLRHSGNWTAGQVFNHPATWMEFLWTACPIRVPFYIRWMLKVRKARYLDEGLPAGVRIPRVEGGTLGTEPAMLEVGLRRYLAAIDRLEREAPTEPSPVFGPLTHDVGIRLNLRHAELHLSFLHP